MNRSHHLLSWLYVLLFTIILGCTDTTYAKPTALDDQVNQLLDADYDFQMRTYPLWASIRGDRRFDTELPDLSIQSLHRRRQEIQTRLNLAEALVSAHLTERARTNLELLISYG